MCTMCTHTFLRKKKLSARQDAGGPSLLLLPSLVKFVHACSTLVSYLPSKDSGKLSALKHEGKPLVCSYGTHTVTVGLQ